MKSRLRRFFVIVVRLFLQKLSVPPSGRSVKGKQGFIEKMYKRKTMPIFFYEFAEDSKNRSCISCLRIVYLLKSPKMYK